MKYKDVDWSKWSQQPEEEAYNDWLLVRKGHKAVVTQTAINRLAPHINKLVGQGVSSTESLGIAVENGWRGLKYQWVMNHIAKDMDGLSDFTRTVSNDKPQTTREMTLRRELTDRSWADE